MMKYDGPNAKNYGGQLTEKLGLFTTSTNDLGQSINDVFKAIGSNISTAAGGTVFASITVEGKTGSQAEIHKQEGKFGGDTDTLAEFTTSMNTNFGEVETALTAVSTSIGNLESSGALKSPNTQREAGEAQSAVTSAKAAATELGASIEQVINDQKAQLEAAGGA